MRLTQPTFQSGDLVSYADIEAKVVLDYGDSQVYVEIPGEGKMWWYKFFDGEPVKLIQAAA